jgi:histone H2A
MTPPDIPVQLEDASDGTTTPAAASPPPRQNKPRVRFAKQKPPTSRSLSTKLGLIWPIGRIHRYLKGTLVPRCSKESAVATAALLEFLTVFVLDKVGGVASQDKKTRILPRHLTLVRAANPEVADLIQGVIREGGVAPHIEPALLEDPKKKKKVVKLLIKNAIDGVKLLSNIKKRKRPSNVEEEVFYENAPQPHQTLQEIPTQA